MRIVCVAMMIAVIPVALIARRVILARTDVVDDDGDDHRQLVPDRGSMGSDRAIGSRATLAALTSA